MSELSSQFKYTKDHEWVLVDGDTAKVGITDFAQSELGEVVYIELPEVGIDLKASDAACVIESTKAASDVYCPITGTVESVNLELQNSPDLVNSSPHEKGWLFTLTSINLDSAELMSLDEYKALVGS